MRPLLLLVAAALLFGCSGPAQKAAACDCPNDYAPVCGSDNHTYFNNCTASCAGARAIYPGSCAQCADSDGGKDPLVKGTASAAGLSWSDQCINFTAVMEYYCNGDLVSKEAMACPAGTECNDGACVKPQPASSCTDSDSGPDPYTRGTVTAGGSSFTDTCTADKELLEYDCVQGQVAQTTSPCPSGSRCDSGRCVRANIRCVGSANKSDIFTAGDLNVSVNLVSMEFLDKCLDNQTMRKYYCVGDDYASEDVSCPPDYQCLESACRQIACSDTDGGINIYQAGAVTKGTSIYRDYCSGTGGGTEFYCNGNQVANASFDCPDGYSCNGGSCTKG